MRGGASGGYDCVEGLEGEEVWSAHCGADHSLAICSRGGQLYAWGRSVAAGGRPGLMTMERCGESIISVPRRMEMPSVEGSAS